MKRPTIIAFVLLVAVGIAGILNAAQRPTLTQTEVLRRDLSIDGREVIQMLNVIPPGGTSRSLRKNRRT